MYERYAQKETNETVITRARQRALGHLQGGPPSESVPPPVGFEPALFNRPLEAPFREECYGKSMKGKRPSPFHTGKSTPGPEITHQEPRPPGHPFQHFLAIGLPYGKAGAGATLEVCSLIRENQPTVHRRPGFPDGIITFGLRG